MTENTTPTIDVGVQEIEVSPNIKFKVLDMAGKKYVSLIANDAYFKVTIPVSDKALKKLHEVLEELIEVKE